MAYHVATAGFFVLLASFGIRERNIFEPSLVKKYIILLYKLIFKVDIHLELILKIVLKVPKIQVRYFYMKKGCIYTVTELKLSTLGTVFCFGWFRKPLKTCKRPNTNELQVCYEIKR